MERKVKSETKSVINKVAAVVAVVLLLGGAAVYLSAYTISAKETGIVTQFGKVVRVRTEPGLYWKLPGGIQRVNRFDNRLNIFETQVGQPMLAEKHPIVMRCYVAWKIADPIIFFQSLGRMDNATSKLNDMIVSDLGGILPDYTIDNIMNPDSTRTKLSEIETRLLASSNKRAQAKYGINLVQIGVRRIAYPKEVAEAVYRRMISERSKEASKLRAEGEREADKIKADADRQETEIVANAYKEAEIIKGTGDKEAMKAYAESFGTDPEFFDFLKSLEAYQQILSGKTTLILSTDSELFKYLSPSDEENAQ